MTRCSINYPFFKILCNRAISLARQARSLLGRVRDISNNLKLYRAEILKTLEIEEPGFAANVETGLKPLLAGYDIEEVPMSWINRTAEMGASSFGIVTGRAQLLRHVDADDLERLARATRADESSHQVSSSADVHPGAAECRFRRLVQAKSTEAQGRHDRRSLVGRVLGA